MNDQIIEELKNKIEARDQRIAELVKEIENLQYELKNIERIPLNVDDPDRTHNYF